MYKLSVFTPNSTKKIVTKRGLNKTQLEGLLLEHSGIQTKQIPSFFHTLSKVGQAEFNPQLDPDLGNHVVVVEDW